MSLQAIASHFLSLILQCMAFILSVCHCTQVGMYVLCYYRLFYIAWSVAMFFFLGGGGGG